MQKINNVFAIIFAALMVTGLIGAICFGKTHQYALVFICAIMAIVFKTDKSDFQIINEEEK